MLSETSNDSDERESKKTDSNDRGDGPVVYRCPINGCNRTTIDDPSGLRSHVRQAGDDAHRFRTLNEELEFEFDEEAYHSTWGPGPRDAELGSQDSIYEPDDPWGPGIPQDIS